MRTSLKSMPSRAEFTKAEEQLKAAGWIHGATMMVDDAHKEGVTNFGKCFHRNGETFWLNFKTLGNLPM